MVKGLSNLSEKDKKEKETSENEFKFASKEGLIIVSLILFLIYAIWYKIFEINYGRNYISWYFIFKAFSIVVFITMTILLITGVYVFWKDRYYIITHEKFGGLVFIIGAIILFLIPLGWTFKLIDYQGSFAYNSLIFILIGIFLCILGSIILARTGGFFTTWIIGILLYLIMSFHEVFDFIVWTEHFGYIDNFLGYIGIFIVVSSFLLFLYHDLKFFYLSRIIKQGNKFRKEKKYTKAMRCFKKTLKIYPLFTTAWNNMGNVYYNKGNFKDAIRCYNRALTINPNYKNAKKNLDVVKKKVNLE